MEYYNIYKRKYHFSLNFYSVFLIVTFIPDLLGIDETLIKYSLWFIRALAAFWIIRKYHKKIYLLNWKEKLFVFTVSVYFINIFIDVFWQYFPLGMGNPVDLISFLISILIAFAFRYDRILASKDSYYFFITSLSIGLFIAFFLAKESPLPLIGRFDANSTVNTINYGQMGCALSLVSLYGFLNINFKFSKVLYPFLFLLGILSIMKAGSRSPVVVLLVVIIFYFFAKSGFVKGLLLVGCSFIVIYFSLDFLIELSESIGSSIVTRLMSAIETGETSGRDAIYANAIEIFKKSPVFGDYYLISSGIAKGYYPHNFFIEAFMATGLLGGIPFTLLVIISLIKSYDVLNKNHTSGWIILLYLQIIVYGMFSSSLYSSQDFWALSFFILSMTPIFAKKNLKTAKYPRLNTLN